jgi:hypothetical protein
MSNGERFEVRHPEMAALQKSNLIVSCPDSDQFEVCALLHIANITTNDSASSVP